MKWEPIDNRTERAKVFGGWLVMITEPVVHQTNNGVQDGWDWRLAICFVPDPEHQWELETL